MFFVGLLTPHPCNVFIPILPLLLLNPVPFGPPPPDPDRARCKRFRTARTRSEYPATNANCTKVRVTGYLNRVRIDLPVLELRAEERYHRQQRRMNPTVEAEGTVKPVRGVDGEDPPRCGEVGEGRSLLRRREAEE
jgi:hypothetical protein